jgi:hypothetical protein
VDGELLQDVRLLRVKVEAHLAQPLKVPIVVHPGLDEGAQRRALVHILDDETLYLLPAERRLLLQHAVGERAQHGLHGGEDSGQALTHLLPSLRQHLLHLLNVIQMLKHLLVTEIFSVADPGCLSRIQIFPSRIPDPHQRI